jgi:hypothetical protein
MSYSDAFDVMDTIDPDFAQSFERCDAEPYFVRAECWTGCEDPSCHYVHSEGWKIKGVQGIFATETEALEAKLAK